MDVAKVKNRGAFDRRAPALMLLSSLAILTACGPVDGLANRLAGPARPTVSPAEYRSSEREPLTIRATGIDYEWHYAFPGPDGRFDTPDDRRATGDLHVPAPARVEIQLISHDYVYLFGVPDLGLTEMAAPDMQRSLVFQTQRPGRLELLGDMLCGGNHEGLRGDLVIQSTESFQEWLTGL